MGLDLWTLGRGSMDERELAFALERYGRALREARRALTRVQFRNRLAVLGLGALAMLVAGAPIGILRGARPWVLVVVEAVWVPGLVWWAWKRTTLRLLVDAWTAEEQQRQREWATCALAVTSLRAELQQRAARAR